MSPLDRPRLAFGARRTARIALAAALAAALSAAAAAPAAGYAEGEKVVVSGVVTDRDGNPVPGLRVIFEASRRAFNLRRLNRVRQDPRRVATVTDEKGEYSLTWPWQEYFNRFDLVLGIDVRDEEGERFREVERVDLTRRMLEGSPVVATVSIEEEGLVRSVREFKAALDTPDELRVYQQMGQPARVQRLELAGGEEVTWWYFQAGKAYRFTDGRLEQVVQFEPVRSF